MTTPQIRFFRCNLWFVFSNFWARQRSKITKERKGEKGFGYDSIFLPKGVDTTFAQMTKKQKGAISHRGRATKKLVEFLQKD